MRRAKHIKDIVGNKYGRLFVVSYEYSENRRTFWKVVCDCGKEKVIPKTGMVAGRIRSCGCLKTETSRRGIRKIEGNGRLPRGESCLNALYSEYRSKAKKSGKVFQLEKELFKRLTSSNCTYCDAPPSSTSKRSRANGEYKFTGIDRVDSSKGYTPDNVVSCCGTCNFFKRHHSQKKFLAHCSLIHLWQKAKNRD